MDSSEPTPSGSPRPPRRRFLSALAGFMEERNILWGELVGGLLVVGCSLALVISLWHTFNENPIFKFCTFTGAVASVFGAGLYTLHRWKLESTSRGLLLVACLLTPVCQLAMILPGGKDAVLAMLSLLLLTALVFRAGRVLTPDASGLLALATLLTVGCQLPAIRRGLQDFGATQALLFALLPVLGYGLTCGCMLWREARRKEMDGAQGLSVLLFLGVTAFPLLVTLGLFVWLRGEVAPALGLFAPVFALVGLPALVGGALVHRGLTNDPDAGSNRAAGTIVALAGMVVMLLAAALSWPRPWPVLAVCLLDFAALTVVAFRFGLPVVHALAVPCLTAAFVTACSLFSGAGHAVDHELPGKMLDVVTSPQTGVALLLLFGVCGLVAEWMAREGAVEHGRYYAAGAIGLLLMSLALVTRAAVDPLVGRISNPSYWAALVYGIGGAGTLLLNRRWRRDELTYLGLSLLIGASLWGLWKIDGRLTPAWGAVLAVESLVLTMPRALRHLRNPAVSPEDVVDLENAELSRHDLRRDPWIIVGTLAAWAAVVVALRCVWQAWEGRGEPLWSLAHVATGTCLAVLWTVRALTDRDRLFARLGAWHGLAAIVAGAGWAGEVLHLDGFVLASVVLSLAGAGFAVAAVRFRTLSYGSAGGPRDWGRVLASAWAEAGGGAALLALLLAVPSAILAVVFNQTSDSPGHAATFAGAAATAFLLAWCYGQDRLALAGSWGILAVFAHLLLWDIGPDYVAHPVLAALLVHASMALTASLVLERRLRRNESAEGEDWCRRVRYLIIRPLSRTGIWSTLLAVPFIAGGLDGPLLGLAVLTLWLALLWLAGAWVRRRWDLFAAFQAALAVTVLLAVSGVYQVRGYRPGEPRDVQIHALALGVLSLLWVLARRTPRVFGLFADLLPRGWPAVDRVVLAGLIGVHFLTAAVILAPGVAAEYALERAIAATPPAPAAEDELPDNIDPVEEVPPAHQEVAKPPQPDRVNLVPQLLAQMRGATQWPAWTLTTLLAVILLIEARVSVHRGVVLGFLALAVTTALLVSALFAADHAVTYGLRWSLAICFLICSLPVWFRDSWGPRLERFGFRAPAETDLAALARRVLVICTVVPVLLLAIAPPLLRLYGVTVSPPLESSLFGRMPRIHATVWPLTFICFGLIVHALRERLPDYAFVVGLGGNVLASIILRASLKVAAPLQTWWLPLVQANVIAFGIAALFWLIARRRLYGERGTGPFLDVQVRLALYGNLVLLAGAFIPLLVDPSGMARTLVQAGHWRGWLALALAGTATWWYLTATQRPRLPLAMALGLAASVLLAASAAWLAKWRPTWLAQPWLAFHVLTAAWTVCGTVFLAFLWRQDARVRRSDGTISPRSIALREIARQWMGILILMLLGLALRATIAADPLGPWWSAGVVLGGGALTAGMAIWQRRGDWAFAAGLCLNLAVSLVVWHTIRTEPGTRLWVWLLQANVIASAAVSCLWLLTRRRMVTEGSRLTADLWLFGQIMLGLAGNLILLGHAAFWLIALPHAPPESVALVGVTSGWLAFTATLVPIVWFAGRALFKGGLVLLTGLTLSLAVLTAATAAHWDHDWLAYHVLLAGCGLAVVPPLLSGIRIWSLSNAAEPVLFALDTALQCVVTVCGLTLALALNSTHGDPHYPWWAVGTSLYVGGISAVLAYHRRREVWVFAGGLCVQSATTLAVLHLQHTDHVAAGWGRLLQANAIAGAAVAVGWLSGMRRLYGATRPALLLRLQVFALLALNTALLIGPLVILVLDPAAPSELVSSAGQLGGWLSLGLALGVVGMYTGRTLATESANELYGLGLASGVLIACTFAQAESNWRSYHVLLVVWAALGGVILTVNWRKALRNGANAPETDRTGANWVMALALLVLGLALRSVPVDPDKPWWPAGGVLAAAALALGLALRLKREIWAFAATLGVNLAVSLVLWEEAKNAALSDWWPELLRGNLLSGMIAVAVWLAGARRLYGHLRPALSSAPLLTLYVALGLAGAALLVVEPAVLLTIWPEQIRPHIVDAGKPINWLALAAVAGVGWWHLRLRLKRGSDVGTAAAGVVLAILAGCFASRWDHAGSWLAYHVMTVGCVVAGGMVLGRGLWRARRTPETPTSYPWRQDLCVIVPDVLVLALAVRGIFGDPFSTFWSAGVVLAVGLQASLMAGWRRSETWAGAATLLCDLAVSLFLLDADRIANFNTAWIFLLQANVLTLAISSLVWLAAGRRLYGERPAGLAHFPLLSIQIFLGLAGNAALLFNPELFALVYHPGDLPGTVAQAGGWMGWATLGANALAVCLHLRLTRMRGGAHVLGGLGVGAVILSAFTAARWDTPESWLAYHVLMLAFVVLGGVMLAGGWLSARRRLRALRDDRPPGEPFISESVAEGWLSGVAIPVIVLALRAVYGDPTGAEWSAGCILGVSLLGALLSLWQRRERWALLSGLGVNLAVSLLLVRSHEGLEFAQWWPTLLHANVVVCGAVALLWIAAKVRLVRGRALASHLLGLQIGMGVLGNVVALGFAALHLIQTPGTIHPAVLAAGLPLAWAALATVAVATVWYTGVSRGPNVVQVLSPLLLGIGVLAACTVAQPGQHEWQAYHVLLSAWSLTGLALIPIAWFVSRRFVGRISNPSHAGGQPVVGRISNPSHAEVTSPAGVDLGAVKQWGILIGGLILALAVRGSLADPSGAEWSAAAIIAASAMAGMAAVWRRSEVGAFAAALGVNLALTFVVWRKHAEDAFALWWVDLVQVNVFATSATALAWLAAARWLYDDVTRQKGLAPLRAVQVLLGLVGNAVLLLGPVVYLIARPDALHPIVREAGGAWYWATFAVALTPAAWHWWGRGNRGMAHLLCGACLGIGVLAACFSAGFVDTEWRSYHVLAGAWAIVGFVSLGASGIVARRAEGDIPEEWRGQRRQRSLIYQGWVVVIAALVLGLGLRGVPTDPLMPWWPAGSVLAVGVLAAGLAVLQRREAWAFLAALCVNLAVSLVIVHHFHEQQFADWWVVLLQANVAASSAAALAWLGGIRFLNRAGAATPLLTCQTLLGLLGNAVVLIGPALSLIARPDVLDPSLIQAGRLWGWLTFAIAVLPAVWHFHRSLTLDVEHLVGILGLAIGVLAACTLADRLDSSWIGYRTLTASVGLTALLFFFARQGWARGSLGASKPLTQQWSVSLAFVMIALVLRGVWFDPSGPLWSSCCFLLPAALFGGLSIRRRRELWVFLAGVCLNFSVSFAQWQSHLGASLSTWLVRLFQINLLAAGLVGIAWTMGRRKLLDLYLSGRDTTSGSDIPLVSSRISISTAPDHHRFFFRDVPLLNLQVFLVLMGIIVLFSCAAIALIHSPASPSAMFRQFGDWPGMLAGVLGLGLVVAHIAYLKDVDNDLFAWVIPLFIPIQLALVFLPIPPLEYQWVSYHVLVIGWAFACPLSMTLILRAKNKSLSLDHRAHPGLLHTYVGLFVALTLFVSLRAIPLDPFGAIWAAIALGIVAASSTVLALAIRRESWAFLAACLVNLIVSLLLWHVRRDQDLEKWWLLLLQANVISSAVIALAWLAVVRRLYGDHPRGLWSAPLLSFQVALGLLGNAALLAAPAFWLIARPGDLPQEVGQAGEWRGWLALLLALAAAGWHAGRVLARGGVAVLCGLGLSLGVLAACSAAPFDRGDWLAYHVLLVSWTGVAAGVLAFGWWLERRRGNEPESRTGAAAWQSGAAIVGLLAVLLVLRGMSGDASGPWWSAAILFAVSWLFAALALWRQDQLDVYVSGGLLIWATILAGMGYGYTRPVDVFASGLLAVAVAAGVWSGLDSWLARRTPPLILGTLGLPFAHLAALIAVGGVFISGLFGAVLSQVVGANSFGSPLLWPAFTATCFALLIALWDQSARFPLVGLYLVGLGGIGLGLCEATGPHHWVAMPILGAYITLASLVRRAGPYLHALKEDLGLSNDRRWPTFWFFPAQLSLAALVVLGSLVICLTGASLQSRWFGGPFAVMLLIPAVVLLAHSSDLFDRSFARFTALGLIALAPAEAVWATLDPTAPLIWLQRGGLLFAVLSWLTILYGVVLPRLASEESGWPAAGRRSGILAAVAALGLFALILTSEAALFSAGRALLPAWVALTVLAAAGSLIAAGICFALSPGLDPLRLPERLRSGYVYAAELLLVAAFVHLRLSVPYLFNPKFAHFWPFIVLGLAFLGTAVSEVFERFGVRVLSDPLRRTGIFLPLIPVLGFWMGPGANVSGYASLWFSVGLFYGLLAVYNQSLALGLLAALSGNAGLWAVLVEQQMAFVRHPQLWLVPFALIALVGGHLNRDRLGRKQTATIRYFALTVIYLASTAETFLTGLDADVTRPLLLVALSLIGVFAGMMLRIRAFLFLGSGFMSLGIFALVRQAATAKTWVWQVAGIILGLLIIVLFAVFEKRRKEVLRLLERLREWE